LTPIRHESALRRHLPARKDPRVISRQPPGLLRQLLAPSSRRAVLTGLGVWALVVAVTFVVVSHLDRPTGSAPPDAAQPIVGRLSVPSGAPTAPGLDALPPLALALDAPLPPGLRQLDGPALAARVRDLAARTPTPLNLDRLGAAEQGIGDAAAAQAAYGRALAADPADVPARVGLALVDGSRGPAGLTRAARTLAALARQHPSSLVVAFNQGLVAVYRRDTSTVLSAWKRAAALGTGSALGRTARGVVAALEQREAVRPGTR
jgi:hypothetical protein